MCNRGVFRILQHWRLNVTERSNISLRSGRIISGEKTFEGNSHSSLADVLAFEAPTSFSDAKLDEKAPDGTKAQTNAAAKATETEQNLDLFTSAPQIESERTE